MDRIEKTLEFWFGKLTADDRISEEHHKRWFAKNSAFDRTIREQFGQDVARALAGSLDGWSVTPRGTLALVILLDQFTRNIFRNAAESFSGDTAARALVLQALEDELENRLRPIERFFLLMPLMHTEDRDIQRRSVKLFEQVAEAAPGPLQETAGSFADSARRHCDIVLRFGRFPHRNAILGRNSTPDEMEFLSQPQTSF